MSTPARIALGLTASAAVWAAAGLAAFTVMQWQLGSPYRAAYRHYKTTGQRPGLWLEQATDR